MVERLEDRTLLSSSTLGTASAILQQGVNGYAGMTNAYISGSKNNVDTNYAGSPTLYAYAANSNSELDSLLRWNLSSAGVTGQVTSASITLNVTQLPNFGPFNLYALNTSWDPNSVTFDQAATNKPWEATGAYGANDSGTTILGTFTPTALGAVTVNLNSSGIALVQSWVNNPSTNDGFIIRGENNGGGGGKLGLSSTSDPTATNAPILSVNYALPGLYLSAGPNEGVTQTSVLNLSGSAVDIDPGATQAVTTTWSQVSGSGTVSFQNASSLTSDAVFSAVGTYVLQLSGTDGVYSSSSQVTITVEPPPPDLPPLVNAGANQAVTLGQSATLAGQVTQAGTLPLTDQWSQLSGPGTALFANSQSATTTVQFTATGTYVLDLVATDGTLAGNSTVTVTVNPAGATTTNAPPVASAGANQTVNQGAVVNLNGSVTYTTVPGATLSTLWQVANGPGTVTFANSAAPQTTATFSAAGTYYLRLLATYGTATDQSYTIITVNPVSQPSAVTLQQGLNNYSGMTDTYLNDSKNADGTNYVTSTTLTAAGAEKYEEDALLLWNLSSVSGTIQSASITVYVTTGSTTSYNLYALSRSWNPSQVTFDAAASGQAWQQAGANGSADYNSTILGTLTSTGTGFATITLNAAGIAQLQKWISNPSSNYGFIVKDPNTSDSAKITFASSKYATVADRPALTITVPGGSSSSPPSTTITNPAASAAAAVSGTSGAPGFMTGVGLNLATLYYQYVQYQQSGSTSPFQANLTQAGIAAADVSGTNVSIFVTSESSTISQLTTSLQSLGMNVTLTSGTTIGGWIPISQLANATIQHGLVSAIPAAVGLTSDVLVGTVAAPQATPTITAPIDPAQMRTAYGINLLPDSGAGETIAIVDAYNDPTIITDSNAFSSQFGLPQFNVSGGPTLTVLNQTGGTTLPANATAGTGEWDVEISLDVQWAHSIAPNANIILFETNSASGDDLFQGVVTAAAYQNVSVVSMSFGSAEFVGENALDPIFTTPTGHQGVTFLAATGDNAAPSGYPAYSPNVVAVGGTSLYINANGTYVSESGWAEGAGGVSNYEPQPAFQIGKVNGTNSTNRTNPDVSMDADPNTGVFVVDSFLSGSTTTYLQVGGTSLATPMWAGLVALANQVRANASESSLDGPSQTLPRLYNLPTAAYHDITTGNNGFPATAGYDLVTGIGSPVANILVPDLAGISQTQSGPSVTLSVTGNPIAENGGVATITATLSAATTVPVTVNLQFSGTATFGTEYSVSSTQIVIAAGQTTGSITITAINTNLNVGNQTIIATAVAVQNGTPANGSQSVTIIALENEAPTITLTTSGGSGPSRNEFLENGGTVTVTATLNQAVAVPVTIALGFSGDAVLGTDYSASASSITIAAGQTSGTITLTGLNDKKTGASAPIYITILSITPSNAATTVVGSGSVTAYVVFTQIGNPLPIITITATSSGSANENGGQMVLTISRSSAFDGSSAVQLIFNPNGTDTAILGTNYTATDANGNALSSGGFVFLDGLSTTVTITGIDDHLITPNLVFTVAIGEVFDGVLSASANTVTGTIVNTDTTTGVSLTTTSRVFTQNGGQMTVTATLLQTFSQNVYVNLAFTGTAIANDDYTITNAANPSNPLQILIPAGSLSGSLVLTGATASASNDLFAAQDTVTVGIVSATNAVPVNTQSVTSYLVSPTVPVVFSAQDAVVAEGGIAAVQIQLNQAQPFPVSVEYVTVNGSASAGTSFTGQTTPVRITFPAGQTSQTIYVQTNDNITSSTPATQNFFIELESPSLNVPTSAAPVGVGVEIANNPSTTYAATVTMLNTIQVAANGTGATSSLAGTSPPDPAGAEGDGKVAVMVSGLYNVFNTAGQEVLSESLTKFWSNAGVTPTGTPFSSRIVYDTNSDQWVAVALDTSITSGVEQANNNVLIAVSDGSDPTGLWTAFTLPSTSATSGTAPSTAYGTSVTLGMDELAANITVDLSNLTESLITIPTISLFPPGTAKPGDGGYTAIPNITAQSSGGQTELSLQPTTDLSGFEPTNVLLGIDENLANTLDRFDVESEGNATTKAIVAGPTPISISPATLTNPVGAAQPGTSVTINTGSDVFPTSLYQVGNDIWAVQTVADATTGNSDIQWFEISYSTNAILQHGLISNPNLSFYDPSVAANSAGEVVIGFNGSGKNQYVSAYAVMGTTTSGATTFTTPMLLKQGVADYNVPVTTITGASGGNAWGNYSETVVDGDSSTNAFWTFQEYASGPNQWSVGFFKIAFGVPTQSQPTVTLSSSSPPSFNENGTNSATVTATLAAISSTATTIDLGYSGSAVANLDYTISNPNPAAGNSPVQIVIPAGSLTGSVVLTGANNPLATGGETVDVSVTTVNGSVPASPSSVVLSIADQLPPQISIEGLTVIENGTTSTANVVVRLSAATSSTVTVSYSTGSGGDTAFAGTDYTAESGVLTFPAGTTEETIAIPLLVDGAATGALQFTVNLSTPTGGTLASPSSVKVTLVEANPQITIEDTSVIDTSPTTAQVTVLLSQDVPVPVTVNFQTSGGTAIPGTNYISETGQVVFAANTMSQIINIPILGDVDQTQTESFNVVLSSPSLGTIVRSTATVTLFDVQPGTLPPDQFDTASGTTNFTADTSASGPFAPADPSGAVGSNDVVVFDSNTFHAFNKSTGTLLQTSTLNQFWTSAIGPQISVEDQTAVETGTGANTNALVTVRLSSTSSTPVTVQYQTLDGTATHGVGGDYTATAGTLTFNPNGPLVQTISIPLLGNSFSGSPRTFIVNLTTPMGASLERSQATVTLLSTTPPAGSPTVSLSVSGNPFLNASGTATVTATLSATSASPTVVNLVFNGTAVLGQDYFTSGESIVIAAGATTGSITLTRNAVQTSTSPELVIVGISTTNPPAGAIAASPQVVSATLTSYVFQPRVVYDPATGRWYASALAEAIPPGSVGPADSPNEIVLAVSKTSDPTQGWIGFAFPTDPTGLTAAEFDSLGFDGNSVVVTANMYTIATGAFVNNAVLSVPKADLTGASATVARASILFTAPPVPATSISSFDPAVNYDSSTTEVLLGESSGGPQIETVTGGGGPTITVNPPTALTDVSVDDGTVITTAPVAAPQPAGAAPLSTGPGVDFNGLDPVDSRFSGTIAEYNGHLWAAQTVGVPNGANPATQDEIQWFEINIANDTILQHGVISQTGLSFYDPSTSVDSAGDVAIGFSGSSLTQQISSYAVYWASTSSGFTSPILLKQGTGIYAGFSNAAATSATINAPSTFLSSGGTDTITVSLTSPAGAGGAVIDLGFSGTALVNRDYSIAPNLQGTPPTPNAITTAVGSPIELFIPQGSTTGSIVLTGLGNLLATGDQTVNVFVTSINGVAPTTSGQVTLTLQNNTSTTAEPNGAPLITAENLSVVESTTSTAQVLLRLSQPVLTPVTVDYQTQDGTAHALTDYDAVNSSVTFAPGQTVATINVPLLTPDPTVEGKTFSVVLTQPSLVNGGRGTLVTTTATVTLLPSYPTGTPTVTLGPTTYSSGSSFAEDSGTATVTATISGAHTDTLINLTFSGSALFGTDYVTSGETIFIPAGATTGTGTITLSGNDVGITASGLGVTVGVSLVNGVAPLIGVTPTTAALSPGGVASASISGTVTVPLIFGPPEPLAGVIVYLVNASVTPNNAFNPSINVFTTTDANGNYSFTGLPAGSYTVRELIPSNAYVVTSSNLVSVTLTPDEQATPTTIPNLAFKDQFTAIWGAYSATVLDPSNVGVFWTFQSFDADQSANDFNTWGVQATELAVTNFTADTSAVQPEQPSFTVSSFTASSTSFFGGGAGTNGSTDLITVTISKAQSTATTISLGFNGGNGFNPLNAAEPNRDYTVVPILNAVTNVVGAPVELIIPAGQLSGSVELQGIQTLNNAVEPVNVFINQINLATQTSPPPLTVSSVPVTSLTLFPTDDISIENAIFYETGVPGVAKLTVRLNEALASPFTVQYQTQNGTGPTGATAGVDYTAESGTLTIPTGNTIGFISIPITGAALTQPYVQFTVQLSNPSVGTIINPTATVTLLPQPPTTGTSPYLGLSASPTTILTSGVAPANQSVVTATLSSSSPYPTVAFLSFGGTTPFDMSPSVTGQSDYEMNGESIFIPAGKTTASITITTNGTNLDNGRTIVIGIASMDGAVQPQGGASATITLAAASTDTTQITGTVTGPNGGMSGVYVFLNNPLPSNVFNPNNAAQFSRNPYTTTDVFGQYTFDGLFAPGNYSVSELAPANYVEADPTGNYYAIGITEDTSTHVFTFADNWVSGGAAVKGAGNFFPFVNEPAGPADPTGAVGPSDVIQADNNSFIVYNKISGTVETSMTLDQFWLAAWNQEAQDGGVDGLDVLMNAYEPQVVYDSASGRWYVSALDNSNPPYTPFSGTNAFAASNDVLLAVSKDSNPADGWVQFVIPADEDLYGLNPDPLGIDPNVPDHRPLRADAISLGFNAALNSTAVILTANLYDPASGETSIANAGTDPTAGDLVSTAIISIPKEDLLSATTTNDPNVMNNFTSVSEGAYSYGINPQSVVSYDANSPALVLAQAATQTGGVGTAGDLISTALELTTIAGSGTSFSISGNPISIPLPVTYTSPIIATQPNHGPDIAVSTETSTGAQQNSALLPGLVDDGIDQRLSNVVEINGDLWVTQTVLDTTNTSTTNLQGTDAIAWWEIQPVFAGGLAVSGTVIQHGLISSNGTSDPNLFLYFPSIAVNAAGDVVIGFDGSDSTHFISSYTAVGTTFAGVTSFTLPNSTVPDIQLVKSGTGVYTGLGSGVEPGPIGPIAVPPGPGSASPSTPPPELQRGSFDWAYWGAYSATVVDPSNPNAFWTFQSIADSQFSSDTNTWGVQATRISIDQPAVTLSVSAAPTVATPQLLGVMGDNLSAGDVAGTTPGWVAQLKTSGDFSVPVGANQAVDGSLAAGLATQLPEIESLAPSLNYTAIIIGVNDALALVEGTETAAQYTSTIETNIEGAIIALQLKAPHDHLVVGTVPDIFVTPLIEALNLPAATIATDEAVIQTANAAISTYAVQHGVAVIDLYAEYASLLGPGSLTVGGVTFTTASTTDPLFAPDGFNPSTIVQGLLANMVIDAADVGFAAGLTPITDQQLLTNVGNTASAVVAPSAQTTTNFIFASDLVTGQIYKVDATTGALLQTISVADGQDSLLFDTNNPQRIIYTAYSVGGVGEVRRVNQDGTGDTLIAHLNGDHAVDMALTPDGNHVLVVTQTKGQIESVDLVNDTATPLGPTGTFSNGLTFDSSGRLFAIRNTNSGPVVSQLNPTDMTVLASSPVLVGSLDGMTFDPFTGNLFLSNRATLSSGREGITEISLQAATFLQPTIITSSSFPAGFDPDGLEADGQGKIYLASEGGDHFIYVYDIASGTLSPLSNTAFPGLDDLAPLVAGLGGPTVPPPSPTTTGPTYFNVSPYVLAPDANPAVTSETVTATLSQASAHDVVVNLTLSLPATEPDSPTGSVLGTDFFASSESILILAGQTSGSITLTGLGEPSTVAVIGITSLEGAVENTPQQVTAVLSNPPEIPTLSLSSSAFPESGATSETLTATLSAPSATGTVINLSFGGTATLGNDYHVSAESIFIPAGSSSSTGSITLTGNDNLLASNETVIITMTSVNGAYNEVPQQITANLTNIPVTTASISGTVTENAAGNPGMAGVTVYIDENGNGTFEPSAGPGIVADPFTTTTASGAFFFSGLLPGTYTLLEVVPSGFTETAPAGGSESVTLTVAEQATVPGFANTPPTANGSIGLSATDLSGNTLGSPTFNENGGQIRIVATLPQAATNNVVVNLAFTGSAVEGTDYVSTSQSILILAGQTSGSITLTGLARGVDLASNPTLTVSILSVMNANAATSSVTATILEQNDVLQAVASGSVFQDNNYNGVQDPGEPNLANAIVYIDRNGTGVFNPANDYFTFSGQSGSTLGLGNFALDGLVSGTYNIYQAPPAGYAQTAPPNTLSGLTYYANVNTSSTLASSLIFGDAPFTSPNVSLNLSAATIASNGGKATLTVQLGQTTPAVVTLQIKVSGSAPYGDYTLVGPNGTVPLSLSNSLFTVTIPIGQTTASYTITANADSTGTLETLAFNVVSVTNGTTIGTAQAELGIVNAGGGSPALVVDNPIQTSGTLPSGLSLNTSPAYLTAGNQPDFITEAELTGNGQLDFIVANGGTTTISVILNPTSGSPTVNTYNLGAKPTAVVAADFNGDGNLDLAVATANGVTILLGNGQGGFTIGSSYAAGTSPSAIAAGVFTGNGIMDLAVANSGSNNVSILMGNGNGTFQTATNIAVGSDPVDIKAANLAGNSITDLVVANHGTGDNTVSVLINNGSGTFTQTKYTAGVQPNSLAIADFNGDGHLDIAVANVGFNPTQSGNINTVSVLFGNGSGQFTPVAVPISGQPLPAGAYAAGPSVWSIAAGDVNGDGHPDIVVTNNGLSTNEVTVLLNNGNGTFQAPVAMSVGKSPIPVSVVTGDFYNNGAIDIATANDWGTGGVDGVAILQNQTVYTSLAFHVYLSHASSSTVTVKYSTANGTATAGTDYLAVSGTLIFAPGQTEETVYVPVLSTAGANKTVILQLSSASNAPIQIGTGVGTINPAAPAAMQATASVSGGKLTINDPAQNDVIKIDQLSSGVDEVLVNGEVLGVYSGVTGQIAATTPNGLDDFVVDEEVTSSGAITDPAMGNPSDDDFVFAELANGASWTIAI